VSAIVTDLAALRQKCEPARTVAEGLEVARRLTAALTRFNKRAGKAAARGQSLPKAIGLAAPQIGVNKRVAVVCIAGKLTLVNPRIVRCSPVRVPFKESCLSLPGVQADTFRHVWVEVACDNWDGSKLFGPLVPEQWNDPRFLLTSVCVQHECAHLAGLLCTDFGAEDGPPATEWGSGR
jgi:peptide deformylase